MIVGNVMDIEKLRETARTAGKPIMVLVFPTGQAVQATVDKVEREKIDVTQPDGPKNDQGFVYDVYERGGFIVTCERNSEVNIP